uniref:DNA_pol3_finger domain-containing protein n=1 Tax=Rhabditophanes sp. KR3021 TaxID=114890 RepID=A0AC35TTJ2_9BILA
MTQSDRFIECNKNFRITGEALSKRNLDSQYAFLYQDRQRRLGERILKVAKGLYGDDSEFADFTNIEEDKEILIFGVIIRKMGERDSVLKQLNDEDIDLEEVVDTYYDVLDPSPQDRIFVENSKQRLLLEDVDMYNIISGSVLGFKGILKGGTDIFKANSVIYPKPLPVERPMPTGPEKFICFTSGLSFRDNSEQSGLDFLDMMMMQFRGQNGPLPDATKRFFDNTETFVFAGGMFESQCLRKKKFTDYVSVLTNHITNDEVRVVDDYLNGFAQLGKTVVMASKGDLCTFTMPQQPAFNALYSKAHKSGNLLLTSNPTTFKIGNITYSGTSGENIWSIRKTMPGKNGLNIMQKTLEAQHYCPTCPDIVDGIPGLCHDYMIMESYPQVYFCGNQKKFGWGNYYPPGSANPILLLSIPSFREKNSVVFVNTRTLEITEYIFKSL